MLTGDFESLISFVPRLHPLVQSFAAGHVSRFPMTFQLSGTAVHFFDSRFSSPVAKLYVEDNSRGSGYKYKLYSSSIRNEKYSDGNSGYHTRSTSNMKNMLGWLKAHVQLVPPEKIGEVTFTQAKSIHNNWKREFAEIAESLQLDGYGSNVSNLRAALAKDLRNYIFSGGVPYSHPELARFKTKEFMDAWEEDERRKRVDAPETNIYINPDGTVVRWNNRHAVTYNSVGEMGEEYRTKLALVKMLENNSIIGEVGIKLNSNNFWLY